MVKTHNITQPAAVSTDKGAGWGREEGTPGTGGDRWGEEGPLQTMTSWWRGAALGSGGWLRAGTVRVVSLGRRGCRRCSDGLVALPGPAR